ncbi:MAG: universal stress protein [Desulfobacteraceae bacterium]
MERHLLVTVSEQMSALHGGRFVGSFFENKAPVKLTLFYTVQKPAAVWAGEKTDELVREQEELTRKYAERGSRALQEAKKEMLHLGFPEESIELKLQGRMLSKTKDILEEAARGLYDAVVLGRRGLNWFEEAFDGSVTKEIMEKIHPCPIWICRRPQEGRKGVLLCMDGSEASFRMADHVGFILGKDQPHPVKILVVKGQSLHASPDAIIEKGEELLRKGGVPNIRVTASAIKASSPLKAIEREAQKGGYAAVAVGRAAQKSLTDRVFFGSVSMGLFRRIEHAALWVTI